jgi:hypothetical protein
VTYGHCFCAFASKNMSLSVLREFLLRIRISEDMYGVASVIFL